MKAQKNMKGLVLFEVETISTDVQQMAVPVKGCPGRGVKFLFTIILLYE